MITRREFTSGMLAAGAAAGADRGPVFVSDLSRCEPASALSRTPQDRRWQLIDYQTVEGVKGVMAAARPEHRCPELRLPLNVTGPHHVYLGINYTRLAYPEWSVYGQLDVKLSRDEGFHRIAIETGTLDQSGREKVGVNNDNHRSIQEAFWRTADLSGQSLIFRQPQPPYDRPEHAHVSNLSYVKLVPVTADEQRRWQPDADSGRVALLFCTGQFSGHTSGTYTFHPTSEQWYRDEISPYVDSDVKLLVFEAMRGNYCLFRTSTGDVGSEDNRWDPRWVEPLAAMTRAAHHHGMKIFASLRMIGPQYPMNTAPISRARHYWRHPEWAKRDREGAPLTNWSLAFPQVREYWLGLLAEALERNVDGLQIHLNRSTPFVYYEEPTLAAFQKRYGEDPRRLPDDDPRWQDHCAGYVTQFLREIRALLDRKPGRQLAVTIYGEAHKYDPKPAGFHPKRYGCDVEGWIRERLVDYVMPSPKIDAGLLRSWRSLAGARLHLWPDLMPRTQSAVSYAKLAKKYLEAGADGFCVWDGERRAPRISEWAGVRRLGHIHQLDELAKQAAAYYQRVPLKRLAGFSVQESFTDG